MYKKCGHMVRPCMMAHSSLNQTKVHMGTNQKVLQSYGSVTGWELAALLGLTRILWHVHKVWTWMVLTKANTLLGSRLPQQACTRCIDTCMCFEIFTLRRSQVKEPTGTHVLAFYAKSHMTCMCSDITASHKDVT